LARFDIRTTETEDRGRSRGDAEIAGGFEQEVTEETEGPKLDFLCCLCLLLFSLFFRRSPEDEDRSL
jgi:hypothetical protein